MTEAKSASRRREGSAVTRAAEGLCEDREASGRCGITEVIVMLASSFLVERWGQEAHRVGCEVCGRGYYAK